MKPVPKMSSGNKPKGSRIRLLKSYGLSVWQFEELRSRQNNKCAVCQREFDDNSKELRPNVDHCHKTKIVRGLLCRKCNLAEGYLEKVSNVRRLLDYMQQNELFNSLAGQHAPDTDLTSYDPPPSQSKAEQWLDKLLTTFEPEHRAEVLRLVAEACELLAESPE